MHMMSEIIRTMDDINFLIYLEDNPNINIRGIGYYDENNKIKYIFYEDKNGRFIEEILNPYYNPKDVELFDEMIKNFKSDDIIISEILNENKEALDYVIKRENYNICIEPYDIFGLYS